MNPPGPAENETRQPLTNPSSQHVHLFNSYNELVAGYFAACTSITLLFPLNKLIFRQMLGSINANEAYKQIKSEGVAVLYRGLLPPLLQKSTSYSIMFGTQHEYSLILKGMVEKYDRKLIKSITPATQEILITGIAGGLAGLTEAILTPLERVQAILQIQKYQSSYRHTWHVFEEVTRTHGLKELYRGGTAISMRNSLSNCMFFTLRSPLKEVFPKAVNSYENTLYDFLSGGLLGAVISTIFYPLNVTKSNMQARVGGDFPSILATTRVIYENRDRKIALIFKGVAGNFTRAILAWGITNSVYELVLKNLKI